MEPETETSLFITLSCVGDAVMTTPLLLSLHQHFPDAVFDIVGDKRSSLLFARCPFAGEIINKDKTRFGRGVFDLLRHLRHKTYDVIVDVRTDGLPYLLRARKRYTKLGAKAYGPHAVERMMGVIRAIHQYDPIPPACVWTSGPDDAQASDWLRPLPGKRWLALAPGAGARPEKTWPLDGYAALANAVSDVFTGVILLGTEADKPLTQAIGRKLDTGFVDLAGRTTLLQAAAVLRAAILVLAMLQALSPPRHLPFSA